MRLRELQIKDAPYMLEWMHDENVLFGLQGEKFINNTLQDCKSFIEFCADDEKNIHRAIVDENDIYMGTVSLKHITEKDAEFAIVIRSCAMGKGYSSFGMREIIRIGYEEKGLKEIYWGVLKDNIRGLKFYDKNLYSRSIPHREWTAFRISAYDEAGINCRIWYLSKK